MYKESILKRLLVLVMVLALLPSFRVWAEEGTSDTTEQVESTSSDPDTESEEVQDGQDNQQVQDSQSLEDEVLETTEAIEEPVGGEFKILAAFSPAEKLDNGQWKIEKGVTCTATIRIKNTSSTDWENAKVYGSLSMPDLANSSTELTCFQFIAQEGITVSDWRSDGPPPNHKDAQAKIASLAAGESITLTATFTTSVDLGNEAEIHIRSELDPGTPPLGYVNYDVNLFDKKAEDSAVNTPLGGSANKKQTGAKTGDTSNAPLYLLLGLASIAGVYGVTKEKQNFGRG